MNVLSLDTTAEICSIALSFGDELLTYHEPRPREHAKITLPETEKLLKKAGLVVSDLDMIVFGRGPGSFTGVRIATGLAQGLAFSSGCQLIPVSTLQSLAYSLNQPQGTEIWSAIDARMSEIYLGQFVVDDIGIPVLKVDERVLPPSQLTTPNLEQIQFVGNGWQTDYEMPVELKNALSQVDVQALLPNAADSLKLAMKLLESGRVEAVEPEKALPTYLRDKVTWDQKPKVGS